MTVILLRHGRSTSNTAGTLAGRSPGVDLDERGREQVALVTERLGALPIEEIVRSPLQRCEQTVRPLSERRGLAPVVDDRLAEVDYGSWTGRTIKELLSEPLWKVVQQHPSAAVFPGGEALAHMQVRAVTAVREHDARRCDQVDRRRCRRLPPRCIPAHRRRPRIDQRDQVHRHAVFRATHERHWLRSLQPGTGPGGGHGRQCRAGRGRSIEFRRSSRRRFRNVAPR